MAYDVTLSKLVGLCSAHPYTAAELEAYFAARPQTGHGGVEHTPDAGFCAGLPRALSALAEAGWLTAQGVPVQYAANADQLAAIAKNASVGDRTVREFRPPSRFQG
jgi:hypothetical protein